MRTYFIVVRQFERTLVQRVGRAAHNALQPLYCRRDSIGRRWVLANAETGLQRFFEPREPYWHSFSDPFRLPHTIAFIHTHTHNAPSLRIMWYMCVCTYFGVILLSFRHCVDTQGSCGVSERGGEEGGRTTYCRWSRREQRVCETARSNVNPFPGTQTQQHLFLSCTAIYTSIWSIWSIVIHARDGWRNPFCIE